MTSNQAPPDDRTRDQAAIGIGTMIVFIAMVVVAAVAAAVLINTSGNLQRKSQETGSETQKQVSSNIFIRDVIGNVTDWDGDGGEISNVSYYVALAPGADSMDLQNLVIRWEHGTSLEDMTYNATGKSSCSNLTDGFCVVDVFDAGDGDPSVLSPGDRVKIWIGLNVSDNEELAPRENVDTLFIPETGAPVTGSFTTPATFGDKNNVDLL